MLLAFIGVLILKIGGQSDWVWRVASIVGLLFVCTIGVAAFRREKLRRHLPGFRKIASVIMFTLVASAFVGFTVVALGFAGEYGFHIFFGMLCLFLVISSTMFVLVIASLMTPGHVAKSVPDEEQ